MATFQNKTVLNPGIDVGGWAEYAVGEVGCSKGCSNLSGCSPPPDERRQDTIGWKEIPVVGSRHSVLFRIAMLVQADTVRHEGRARKIIHFHTFCSMGLLFWSANRGIQGQSQGKGQSQWTARTCVPTVHAIEYETVDGAHKCTVL